VLNNLLAVSQDKIQIYSIDNARMPMYDHGYTFNGGALNIVKSLLRNDSLFGGEGIYPKKVEINDAFAESGSLTQIGEFNPDIFFFGTFNWANGSLKQFTAQELDSLYQWSIRGGKLIIATQPASSFTGFYTSILDSIWNFELVNTYSTNIPFWDPYTGNPLFNGPFGRVDTLPQAGVARGYFLKMPKNRINFAHAGLPQSVTMYLDCNTLDLIIADFDSFGLLSRPMYYPPGSTISVLTDTTFIWKTEVFFMNMLAYFDQIDGEPPRVLMDSNHLSVSKDYKNYQWFKDGIKVSDATSEKFEITESGVYHVECELDMGCVTPSNKVKYVEPTERFNFKNPIQIFPNPSTGKFQVTGADSGLVVSIFDTHGRIVYSATTTNSPLLVELTGANATYVIRIEENNGNVVYRSKFEVVN
jgi:hypothetical protein